MSILDTIGHIVRHPFNRGHEITAIKRYLAWQIGTRTLGTPVVVPFVGNAKLVVSAGMAGATGSVYCGLHEFPRMCLTLHLLRAGDLFVDVGANVGLYSILAAETGANCIAFEPVTETFSHLGVNIRLNDFGGRCEAITACVGREDGSADITIGFGPMNHVVVKSEGSNSRTVKQVALDRYLTRAPTMLKIDVEGFEAEVLAGTAQWLNDPALLAVTIEMGTAPQRYGSHEDEIYKTMIEAGFQTVTYEPFTRRLIPSTGIERAENNTIFIRDLLAMQQRVATAKRFQVQGRLI